MAHDRMLATRRTYTWIQKYIFPGGSSPRCRRSTRTLGRAHHAADRRAPRPRPALRPARCALWRERFIDNWPTVDGLGFDETFRRMWEFYLAYCEAGFRTGYLDVSQLQMTREPVDLNGKSRLGRRRLQRDRRRRGPRAGRPRARRSRSRPGAGPARARSSGGGMLVVPARRHRRGRPVRGGRHGPRASSARSTSWSCRRLLAADERRGLGHRGFAATSGQPGRHEQRASRPCCPRCSARRARSIAGIASVAGYRGIARLRGLRRDQGRRRSTCSSRCAPTSAARGAVDHDLPRVRPTPR